VLSKLRITEATLDVLEVLLHSPEEWYGFKIAQKIGRSTGSVFTILARLERSGWAVSEWETRQPSERGALKRLYWLSQEGADRARAVLAERRPETEKVNQVAIRCRGNLHPRAEGAR
jgi:PadR family transcriptional regulator PadR